jgi:hypothetical protein
MAGDAALRLRLASYGVAGLVGFLNYSVHAGPGWAPTPAALAFGAMSTLSPWLWSIRSRSMHRAELRAAGLIDARAVRFSMIRWVLYPRWTWRVWRAAVWAGETNPEVAAARFTPPPRGGDTGLGDDGAVHGERFQPDATSRRGGARPPRKASAPAGGFTDADVALVVAAIQAGDPVSLRSVKRDFRLGEPKARTLLDAARARAGVES